MARLRAKIIAKGFLRKMKRLESKVQRAARRAIAACALDIQTEAKERAPVNTGRLRADIQIEFLSNGLTADVGNTVDYAPFVEFGSGPHGNSKGSDEFIRSITRWAKLVLGLDEDEVYPIIRAIRKRGTHPQPYLTPAWEMVRPKCEANIRKLLFGTVKENLA